MPSQKVNHLITNRMPGLFCRKRQEKRMDPSRMPGEGEGSESPVRAKRANARSVRLGKTRKEKGIPSRKPGEGKGPNAR